MGVPVELDLLKHADQVNQLLARYGVKFSIYKNNVFKEVLHGNLWTKRHLTIEKGH